MYRTVPIIRRSIDKKVELAFGAGYDLKLSKDNPDADKIIAFIEEWLRRINIKEYATVTAREFLIFGSSMSEICYLEESVTDEEIKYNTGEKAKVKKYNGGKPGNIKGKLPKNMPTWLKNLDIRYMRVRRDSYGNDFGYMQWLTVPPVSFGPDKIIHYKYCAWSLGYEQAYGASSLMSLIKTQELIWQMETDMMVVSHAAAKPPVIFDEHDAERYASESEFSGLRSGMEQRSVGSDIFLRYGFKGSPMQQPTGMLGGMSIYMGYLNDQRLALLGVPPQLLGMPEGSSRTTASVSMADFMAEIKILQETFANTFEEHFLTKLLRPIFGEDVEIPEMIWRTALEEDINQKSARLREERRIGGISTNEFRVGMGYDKTGNPKDDKVEPLQTAPSWMTGGFGETDIKEKTEDKPENKMPIELEKEASINSVKAIIENKEPDKNFDPKELEMGTKHEMEHTDDPDEAKGIAKDHLGEDKHYYTHLKEMEEEVKKNEVAKVIKNDNLEQPKDERKVCPTCEFKEASQKYVKPFPKEKEIQSIIKKYLILIKNRLDKLESEYLKQIEPLSKKKATKKQKLWEFKAEKVTQSERDEIDAIIRQCVKIGLSRAEDDGDVDYVQLYNENFILKLQDDQVGYITKLDKDIRTQLNTEISEGISAGETYTQLRDRIRTTFSEIGYNRAELIAVTEVGRAQELTYKESGKAMGYNYKRFMVQPDELVCAKCNGDDPESEVYPGKVFPIDVDIIPNLTHPRCRCYTNFVDEMDFSPEDTI